jgi:ribosomal protein L7/L12
MNFKLFVQSCNTSEFEQLRAAVLEDNRRRIIDRLDAYDYQLTAHEIETAKLNKIAAIKLVRDRLRLGLAESKTLVELRAGV